jgi:hypothetical protein
MKFNYLANFVIAGVLGSAAVQAQSPTAARTPTAVTSTGPADPAKVPLIEDLFQLTKPDAMVQQAKTALGGAAQQAFNSEVKKFDDPTKYQADYQKVQGQLMAIIDSRLNWQKMKPQLMKLYSDSFTKEELTGITAFYRSPAGQAEMRKMPEVAYKTNVIGQQQLAGAQPEMQKVMTDALNSIKQKSPAGHAAPGGVAPPPGTPNR